MINFIARLVICFSCLFFITACLHRVPNTPCTTTCESRYQACTKVCRNNCPQCTAAAGQARDKNYNHYIHEQYVKGRMIALQLNSFRDPLQCRKVTCSCREDYQVCMQSCGGGDGGAIKKYLQHAPLCS
ncbi:MULTISPECIES: acyltransferase [Legionella]|uniref:Acyltransferase n=1 Tax=Legionella maceachernii TaxID=466 RepID=A0A0W0WC15_9GAMM|nr:acyltransferase [Legionella maceachernii]KTD29779.1 acyltransferase [Legionella maceachernii]SJZ79878.1 hypothetical protein SAMN02745128_01110 [Legionella maceachernii]SUP02874.1 Uncharacterised protein [Legionella maceachernii]